MKLLLIEDDVRVAQVLADAFEADGHETAIRYSGEDGLAYLTSERPDAVVLDVRLPTMNGVAVLRRIRSTDPRLPVIIMRAWPRRKKSPRLVISESPRSSRSPRS